MEQVFIAPRDGVVEISLREASSTEEHTLEVWTRSTATAGWVNKIDVIPIEIEGCARFDHFYWQLVTNPNMHLALMPEHLTPEWTWVWIVYGGDAIAPWNKRSRTVVGGQQSAATGTGFE